jgi:hypothetical protein
MLLFPIEKNNYIKECLQLDNETGDIINREHLHVKRILPIIVPYKR